MSEERVVRTCLQHNVALIADTLTCPKGNHPVRKWGTVERARFTQPSGRPRFLGVAEDAVELKAIDAPVKEVKVEEKAPGVHDRVKFQDAGGNELWLYLRKMKLKTPGAHPWKVTWRCEAKNGTKTSGTASTAPTEELARSAFASRRKASWSQGWDEVHAGAGRTRTQEPPPPAKPVKR